MKADSDLYHTDFFAWAQAQGRAIRATAAGGNAPVDWANVAEEIETLGRSERRELSNRIATIIEHLLKLTVSPATGPRRGWISTIRRTRMELAGVLKDSPSLRSEVAALVRELSLDVGKLVSDDLEDAGEATPDVLARLRATTFSPEQVFGDWLPDAPG